MIKAIGSRNRSLYSQLNLLEQPCNYLIFNDQNYVKKMCAEDAIDPHKFLQNAAPSASKLRKNGMTLAYSCTDLKRDPIASPT